ncbi:MAG: tetratricopeptide repeat protein [Gammaproteobacteria bacterium]
MYLDGQGVDSNTEQALFWLKKAALSGNPEYEYFYGVIYAIGKFVPQSYKVASIWFEKAAGKGHAIAASMLGWVYLKGSVVDFERRNFNAYVWLQLALSLGHNYELVVGNLMRSEGYLSAEEKKEAMDLVKIKMMKINDGKTNTR